jgi:hypothetical protein
MSFDEIVSLLPKIASMERRRGLYLELIDERFKKEYNAKKELERKLENQLNK